MRFVFVNGRTRPHPRPVCVMCDQPIGLSYLRKIGTRLTYCNHICHADHWKSAILLLESQAKASSTLHGQTSRAFGSSRRILTVVANLTRLYLTANGKGERKVSISAERSTNAGSETSPRGRWKGHFDENL
jgi:hypothetical protein